jgi:hypothetical protein
LPYKPQLTPYNLQMVNQTTINPLRLIKKSSILVHDILYNVIFIIYCLE